MDNGWNSELAQNNIYNLIDMLGVDLHTHVINWNEYRELMQSFLDNDVIDVELLYDNAMIAVNYNLAMKYNVKYILSGDNTSTEGMSMPKGWNWNKFDKTNIKSVGNVSSFKTFPSIGTLKYFYLRILARKKWIRFPDYFPFIKEDALSTLESSYGYKRYPYKHYESIFTRFYQGYILPNKFKVDKRLLHLSSLVVNNQMSRNDALTQLAAIPYPSENDLNNDITYFLNKMNWSRSDLDRYIARPPRSHFDFSSELAFSIISYFQNFHLLYLVLSRIS